MALEGIGKPDLFWFLPADRPEHKVYRESPRPLAAWTQMSWIFIAADLSDVEVWESVGHECEHIYAACAGYATMITRDQRATREQVHVAHEKYAHRFAESFTRYRYPNR